MGQYSYNNLSKQVKFTPDEQSQADNSERLYWEGQAKYEQPDIAKAQAKTGDVIQPKSNVFDQFDEKQPIATQWNVFDQFDTPQQNNAPKSSQRTFKDDLNDEIKAHPIDANLAAAATAVTDLYQGAKQLFGKGDKTQIMANDAFREANPGSALAGNIALFTAGGVAAPVLNTVKGTAAAGALTSGLSQTEDGSLRSHAGNALIGAGTAAAGTKIANGISNALSGAKAKLVDAASKNATKDAAVKDVLDAGYVAPRSLYNPSFLTNRVESFAGKAASKQDAAMRNQEVTNNLAKNYLGISENESLSPSLLNTIKDNVSAPYREASALPKGVVGNQSSKSMSTGKTITRDIEKTGAQLVDEIKIARDESRSAWKTFNSGTSDNATKARLSAVEADKNVAKLESQMETLATKNGKPDLVNSLRGARKEIAKIHTIDDVMNPDNGDVAANKLATMFNNGKKIDGDARTIVKYANNFKPLTGINPQGAGVSALDAALATSLSAGGWYGSDSPYGATLGLLPLLGRPAARQLALSKLLQKTPNYAQGITSKSLKRLLPPRYAPMALAGATVPALFHVTNDE